MVYRYSSHDCAFRCGQGHCPITFSDLARNQGGVGPNPAPNRLGSDPMDMSDGLLGDNEEVVERSSGDVGVSKLGLAYSNCFKNTDNIPDAWRRDDVRPGVSRGLSYDGRLG